jgi:hypothetical protein
MVPRLALRDCFAMRIRVALTGPPRVLLGRPVANLHLPCETCTFQELLDALAATEPRIARYLQCESGLAPIPLRALLPGQLLQPGNPIPDCATVTLLYAISGG